MPSTFPDDEFRQFCRAAGTLFPAFTSEDNLLDPQERRRQFEWAWQAVRYRYRTCYECSEEFRVLNDNGSDFWQAGWSDEEQNYKLERCIYLFFMSGLSIFDSLSFCLYFAGNALQPTAFPGIDKPQKITSEVTRGAFSSAFPQAEITRLLRELPHHSDFSIIHRVRNIAGHRLSGRRGVKVWDKRLPNGRNNSRCEQTWHLPGSDEKLIFDGGLLQRHLEKITAILAPLILAARNFAESCQQKEHFRER